jgi:hypothetical protein
MNNAVAYITYLIYAIFWLTLTIGGAGYAVFVLDHSGWWMLAAVFIAASGYGPLKWIHGREK